MSRKSGGMCYNSSMEIDENEITLREMEMIQDGN